MEPDVIRLYSSSPPPLDEGEEEEDEDDFGDFGGYRCSVSSSFSFTEFDPSATFSQPYELGLYNTTEDASQTRNRSVLYETGTSEQFQEALNSGKMVYQSDCAVDCMNDKSEAHNVPDNSSSPFSYLHEQSEVSDTGLNKLPYTQHQDLEPSRSSQEKLCVVQRQEYNHDTEQEESGVISFKSIETVKASRTDFQSEVGCTDNDQTTGTSNELNALLDSSFSVEVGDSLVKKELDKSSHLCSTNLGCVAKDDSGEDTSMSLGGSSGMEIVVSCGEIQKQDRFEDFSGFDTPPALVVDPSSDLQCSDESEGPNGSEPGPILVDGIDISENSGHFSDLSEVHRISDEKLIDNNEEPTIGLTINVAIVVTELVGDNFKDVEEKMAQSSVVELENEFDNIKDTIQLTDLTTSTRDDFADFVTALSGSSSDDELGDLDSLQDLKEEAEFDEEEEEHGHKVSPCSALPPSDSFADFTSVPFGSTAGQDGEGWTAFGRQEKNEDQVESWAVFDDKQQCSSTPDYIKTDNVLDGLNPRLQHLFESTFPSEITPENSEMQTLSTLLLTKDQLESRGSTAMWNHLLDVHNAHGLKVQWVGSRSNRILLDCLGIHNILFTGQNKKPMIVPMFAAGLGMLEPTKDPVKHSPAFSASSPSQRRSTLCTQVMSSLSISEDGTSQRRASFSLMQSKTTRHSRQKSYS